MAVCTFIVAVEYIAIESVASSDRKIIAMTAAMPRRRERGA